MPAVENTKRRPRRPRRDLTYRLSDAGIALPASLARGTQKSPGNRHKNSGRSNPTTTLSAERNSIMGSETQTNAATSSDTSKPGVNVPPAGGGTTEGNPIADALQPGVRAMEEAASRIGAQAVADNATNHQARAAAEKDIHVFRTAVDMGSFTLKGAITLGLATAGAYVGRSVWRNRHAPVTED